MKQEHKLALIVAFYISKYDELAYENLGFSSVTATHQDIGKILGVKGSTIQNMRDEFDPHHNNKRKGWWQRDLTPSRKAILEKFKGYSELQLRELVKKILRSKSIPDDISNELSQLEINNDQGTRDDQWSVEELEIAVKSYIFLLKMRVANIPYPSAKMTNFLLDGPLKNRRRPALRTRMRNISDVLHKMGMPILDGYTPAPEFGSNVRKKIEQILINNLDELSNASERSHLEHIQIKNPSLEEVLSKLQKLEDDINDLTEPNIKNLGHNHPPEPIENDFFETESVKDSIRKIREELLTDKPDHEKIDKNKNVILELGFRLAAWTGDRFTDFSKAAAVAAGTGAGVCATDLGSQIVDTVKTLMQYLLG